MNNKLRFAIIGAGKMASRWARAIPNVPGVRVIAVADTDLACAARLAEQFPQCASDNNWKKIIERPDVDAVLVVTPHKFLAPIATAALVAGKHVLSEKPAGIRAAEVRRAVATAKKMNRRYMVGFNHRFHPAFVLARKFFEQGKIGDVVFIRARYGFGGRPGLAKEWRLNRALSGGGELIDQGVHMIDMARSFLGDFPSVMGFAEALYWNTPADDNAFVLLKNKKKQIASIHVSWSNWKPIHNFEIFGTKGYLCVEGLGRKYGGTEKLIWGKRDDQYSDHPVEKEFICDPDADQSLVLELKEFVSAIKHKRDPVPSGRDAYEVLRIVEKVYKK